MESLTAWFCGNVTQPEYITSPLVGQLYARDNHSRLLEDPCFVNLLSLLPHVVFIPVAFITTLFLAVYTRYPSAHTQIVLFPGHTFRWVLLTSCACMYACAIAEGILTDMTFRDITEKSQPHFYIPAIFACMATIASLLYSNFCESKQQRKYHLLLLIYWLFTLVVQICLFSHYHITHTDGWGVFRYSLVVINQPIYLAMAVLEVWILCSKSHFDKLQEEKLDMRFQCDQVNLVSYSFFFWIRWLLRLGYQRPLVVDDLGSLPVNHQAKHNYDQLRKVYQQEMEKAPSENAVPPLWTIYFKTFKGHIFKTFLAMMLAQVTVFLIPYSLDSIISQVMANELLDIDEEVTPHYITVKELIANVYMGVALLCWSVFINNYIAQIHNYECSVCGTHLRSAMQALVYDKSLRISSLSGSTEGQVTNHMSTDAMNLLRFTQNMHQIWAVPFAITLTLMYLYSYVGISGIFGILFFIVLMPVILFVTRQSSKYQKLALGFADKRLKQSREMLQGVKILKLYGWEDMFLKKIESLRAKELGSYFWHNLHYGNITVICFLLPNMIGILIYGTYPYISGNQLKPNETFAVFLLINTLVRPLYMLPIALFELINAMVATSRLKKFLIASEVETEKSDDNASPVQTVVKHRRKRKGSKDWEEVPAYEVDTPMQKIKPSDLPDESVIKIINGSFTWEKDSTAPIIKNVAIDIPRGKLTMVVGAVGSGKSSLLSAIIGEMTTLEGYVQSNQDQIAYTAQTAWIRNATIKDNILFGAPCINSRYEQVLDACSLRLDLDILPWGDQTIIGEKGINLSGGQKQRISVARALYSDKDIVLLDDPLSALDVHVGNTLFQQGLLGMLIKSGRTVVIVTHHQKYLHLANQILVMQDGSIIHQGRFDEIKSRDSTIFQDINQKQDGLADCSNEFKDRLALKKQVEENLLKSNKQEEKQTTTDVEKSTGTQLTQEEDLDRGAVSYKVYMYLMRSMGWPMVTLLVITRLAYEVSTIIGAFWLADWTDAAAAFAVNATGNHTHTFDTNYYVGGYGVILLVTAVCILTLDYSEVGAMYYAARDMHLAMVRNVFRSPMRFFETTQSGRVLNRFTTDTQCIDVPLLVTFGNLFFYAVFLPSALIVIAIVVPILMIVIGPVLIVYYFVRKYFLASARELHRLNNVTRSPIFSHFSETLSGLSTIRAYGLKDDLFEELLERIDTNNITFLYLRACYAWNGNTLGVLALLIMIAASLTSVVLAEKSQVDAGVLGLMLAWSSAIPFLLRFVVRFSAEMECQMNAVERLQTYSKLPSENIEGKEPDKSWPHQGDITLNNVSVRYASHLPSVLKEVTLHIRPGEKVGICGRTGSGKTSLTLAFFRMIDTHKGRIVIDGEDISKLSLMSVRRRLSIIPQEPILFTGSIRYNLDPEEIHSDTDLWTALATAQLKDVVSQLEAGLDYEVSEGGENFSVGQRQLFCLARAFLRNSRILIMDEVTASIDYDTEKTLLEMVNSAFSDKTIITIAHRVSTILNSDTIIVLDDGKIVEHDTPANLLADRSTIFSSFVKDTK